MITGFIRTYYFDKETSNLLNRLLLRIDNESQTRIENE